MPWPWRLATHCLDLQNGNVLHWPFPGRSWRENAFHLDAMQAVWRAWKFFNMKPSQWGSAEIDYYDWLYDD